MPTPALQSFTAGVGNWVADEVLYQARVHPEQPVADMPQEQVQLPDVLPATLPCVLASSRACHE